MNKNNYILIGLAAAIILVGVIYVSYNRSEQVATPDYAIDLNNGADMPSLSRLVAYDQGVPEEVRTALEGNITILRDKLKGNPSDFWSWMDLSMQYKVGGDIEGAKEVWEFLNIAAPNQPLSFANLGSLYHLQFHQYEKSEEMYKKAIDIAPASATGYLGLFELYRYSYKKDTTLAVDTLEKGLEKVTGPEKIDILVAFGSYYKATGDTARSLENYIKARDAAIEIGNQDLADRLNIEINTIAGIKAE